MAGLSADERLAMVAPGTRPTTAPAQRPGLYISGESLARGVHKNIACVDCHKDAGQGDLPHPPRLKPAECASCHASAAGDYLQGAHAEAAARGDAHVPTCSTCHGSHEILPPHDRKALTYPLNIVRVCGDCHANYQQTTPNGSNGKAHVQHYLESVHGRAVTKGGLAVAATCADCHGPHKVLPASDPASSVNHANVTATCGKCHAGLAETFQASIHGQVLAKGSDKGPVCTSCHTAHQITNTDKPAFMLDIVNECGTCHSELYATYRRSYHGQATRLGYTRGARCSSCHGSHDILPVANPASRLSDENRVETCRKCHPDATATFTEFHAHADYRDRQKYPILWGVWMYFVVMMSFAFGFFGLHSLLWLGRSILERIKHGPPPRHVADTHAIQRFNRIDRINHALVIVSFFGLTLTGLPLLYADKRWGRGLAEMLGGVNSAGILHRIFAVMLIGNFVIHGFGLINRVRKFGIKKLLFGPATMLPRKKDVTDCLGMFRWFFRGGEKPRFDRWTYWEKFDYVAEVGGSGIIGLTGLLLWFPEFFGSFLPGWTFNIAQFVHGYEALLAIGFIFTIHFFNAHLRLEKFPVDDVMFTGRLPEDEFKHERPEEYDRLAAAGELDSLRVAPPNPRYRIVAVLMGILAMAIGTTLVVLIILAALDLI